MDLLLLARWQRVAGDVRRLQSELRIVFDACDCRQTDGHLPDLCACCREEGLFLEVCSRSETIVTSLRRNLDALVDDTLRHLGTLALIDTVAKYGNGDPARVNALRRQTLQLVVTFLKVEGAIEQIRGGCSLRHLVLTRALVDRLATTTQGLDAMLTMDPLQRSAARIVPLEKEYGHVEH